MVQDADEQIITGGEDDPIKVALNFRSPVRMPSVYAHHMFAQQDDAEVVISFYEIIQPLLPEDLDARAKVVEVLKETGIHADCVARITVAKHRFPGFADAMQRIADDVRKQLGEVGENADHS